MCTTTATTTTSTTTCFWRATKVTKQCVDAGRARTEGGGSDAGNGTGSSHNNNNNYYSTNNNNNDNLPHALAALNLYPAQNDDAKW